MKKHKRKYYARFIVLSYSDCNVLYKRMYDFYDYTY